MSAARALTGFTPEGLAHVTRRVPCPECWRYTSAYDCPTCDGGTVSAATWVPAPGEWTPGPVALVVEQWREVVRGHPSHTGESNDFTTEWDDRETALLPGGHVERRQVIAATADATEALPVVGNNDISALAPYVRIMRDGKLCVRLRDGGAPVGYYDPGPFTWTPGDTALHLTNVVELNPPVTEVVACEPCQRWGWCAQHAATCRVPLSVVDGDEVTW